MPNSVSDANVNGEIVNVNEPNRSGNYSTVETVVIRSVAVDFTAKVTVTTSLTSVWQFVVPNDTYITEIAILPLTSSNTLSFWIQYGGYSIGSQSNLLQLVNASYSRRFDNIHLPLLRLGDIINVAAMDSVGQSIIIDFSGFRVDS